MDKYDIAILGAGPGGYVAAIKAAQLGNKVLIIERDSPGGLCLNWGCIPTKTLLVSAKHFRDIRRSESFGIVGINQDELKIDWDKLLQKKDSVVNKLVSGVGMLFKKNGIEHIKGQGKVVDKNTIQVNDKTIQFDKLIIATGAGIEFPKWDGIDKMLESGKVIDHKGVLGLKTQPKEIAIVGNNTYAVEFATFFNAIGTKTTLINPEKSIIPYEDKGLASTLERQLKKDGVKIVSEATPKSFKDGALVVERKGKEETYSADNFIVMIGRKANTKGLEILQLELDEKGYIKTNNKLETNLKDVYAIGDVNGKIPLAHVASAEGIVAVENIMGIESSLNYNLVPQVVYSFPEIASVGISKERAKEDGLDFSVGKFPLAANGMAIAEEETVGFIEVISDNAYGEIIGVHIMAPTASDMI
jgi:dihydrolipoamide dehydrogenase